ncbi:hypothetical protein Hanom_Chr16g01438951 [Helianthus anomalus]
MFVPLTKRTKFLVRSFIKRMNTNELPAKRFTNCLLNVWRGMKQSLRKKILPTSMAAL